MSYLPAPTVGERLPCPACGTTGGRPIARLPSAPVMAGMLYRTREAASAASRGPIDLVACECCSMLRNVAFDEDAVDYEGSYDNSLHFSPTFQRYADELARRLFERYDLRDVTIVEVGSGKGDFLRALCELGGNRGLGYDPAYEGEQGAAVDRLTFVPEYFSGELSVVPDLFCARHVLEHLVAPSTLLGSVRRSSTDSTVLYAEVPDARHVLSAAGVWDVIYPHVGYYTAPALAHLVARCGFAPLEVSTSFGGQYLWAEARATSGSAASSRSAAPATEDVEFALALADGFADLHRKTIDSWADQLAEAHRRRLRVALWGAGTKGVTFLTTVPGAANVATVVDVNPRKHGRFLPGTGHEVVGPDALVAAQVDLVLVMNPLYEDEIRRSLAELGLDATVAVV